MNERSVRTVLCLSALLMFFLVNSCAPRKVVVYKPSAPSKKKGVYHVVERHQTLYRICKTYQVDLEEVTSLNEIRDPSKIQTGQRIFIPGAKKVLKVDIYIDDVVAESEGQAGEKTAYPKFDFAWPVEGRISNVFEEGEERRHQGVDISALTETPIRAAGSGTVIYSGNTIRGYGNLIILRHPGEWTTVYAHNQVNLVEEGMWVEKGQTIGKVGETGRASGPHLHFEIRRKNRAVDPLPYLK